MKRLLLLWVALFALQTLAAQDLIFADSVCLVSELTERDAPRTYRYAFENRSSHPVVILRVETTCGCVKAKHDRKPIAPGGRGEIRLTLDPRGRAGALYKTVKVYTSSSGRTPEVTLVLSGIIEAKPKE